MLTESSVKRRIGSAGATEFTWKSNVSAADTDIYVLAVEIFPPSKISLASGSKVTALPEKDGLPDRVVN